jgi:hypothetical protein
MDLRFWLTGDGEIISALDYGHNDIAMEFMAKESGTGNPFENNLLDWVGSIPAYMQEYVDPLFYETYYEWEEARMNDEDPETPPDDYIYAEEYVIENHDWIRFFGSSIQMSEFTSANLKRVAAALEDVFDGDDALYLSEFYIDGRKRDGTLVYAWGVPFVDIASGNVAKIFKNYTGPRANPGEKSQFSPTMWINADREILHVPFDAGTHHDWLWKNWKKFFPYETRNNATIWTVPHEKGFTHVRYSINSLTAEGSLATLKRNWMLLESMVDEIWLRRKGKPFSVTLVWAHPDDTTDKILKKMRVFSIPDEDKDFHKFLKR